MTKYTRELHEEFVAAREREERERKEAAAKAQARSAFIAAGGKESDFESEYRRLHQEGVRETMKRREEEAREYQRGLSGI